MGAGRTPNGFAGGQGVTGLKSLGCRELNYRYAFLACATQVRRFACCATADCSDAFSPVLHRLDALPCTLHQIVLHFYCLCYPCQTWQPVYALHCCYSVSYCIKHRLCLIAYATTAAAHGSQFASACLILSAWLCILHNTKTCLVCSNMKVILS